MGLDRWRGMFVFRSLYSLRNKSQGYCESHASDKASIVITIYWGVCVLLLSDKIKYILIYKSTKFAQCDKHSLTKLKEGNQEEKYT